MPDLQRFWMRDTARRAICPSTGNEIWSLDQIWSKHPKAARPLRTPTLYYSVPMDREYAERLLRTTSGAATATSADPQTLLHASFDAIVQGNYEAFGESLSDDVELNICGFGPLDGAWRGRDEVVAATRRNFALLSNQKPEIEGMISQGDRVAVLLRESGVYKSNGQAYSVRGAQWFTFAAGKITKIDEIVASIWKVAS